MLRDPALLVYVATAVVFAWIAVVTWRRRGHNPITAAALTVTMAGACWWSVALTLTRVAGNETVVAIAMLGAFPGASIMVAAFLCLGLAIARPQWTPQRPVMLALLFEPILITLAGATNPWHQLV